MQTTFLQNVMKHKVGTGGALGGTAVIVGCALTACPAWVVPAAAVVGLGVTIWGYGTHP